MLKQALQRTEARLSWPGVGASLQGTSQATLTRVPRGLLRAGDAPAWCQRKSGPSPMEK